MAEAEGEGPRFAGSARLPDFVVVAGVLTYAYWRYRAVLREHRRPGSYLVAGYAVYAVMAFTGELLNFVVPFYDVVGETVLTDIAGGRLDPGPGAVLLLGRPASSSWTTSTRRRSNSSPSRSSSWG